MESFEERYKLVMEKPLQILDIFNEFFGEDRVDMQGFLPMSTFTDHNLMAVEIKRIINNANGGYGFILVHFPHVKVENENGRSTNINHLYAKVDFDTDGQIKGRFSLNRAEYSMLHISNNYMHSHVSCIPFNDFQKFQTPCTGSGPINGTICSLAREFDADLWRLFCLELDKYVQVESIAGTPYHRLEQLIPGGTNNSYRDYIELYCRNELHNYSVGRRSNGAKLTYPELADFTKYVIDSNILKFSYNNNCYCLAMSATEYYIRISNAFIDWFNKKFSNRELFITATDLLSARILNERTISNGLIYRPANNNCVDYRRCIGKKVCTFKGQDVLVSIPDLTANSDVENAVLLLSQDIAEYVLTKIFNVINFRYGSNRNQENSTHKKVYFL